MSTDESNVEIDSAPDGATWVIFSSWSTVAHLREALARLPDDGKLTELSVLYFSGEEDCEGQELPDEDHDIFVATLTVRP
jgi:hypothetical protein